MPDNTEVYTYKDGDIPKGKFEFNLKERKKIFKKLKKNSPKISKNDIRRIALWKYSRVLDIPDDVLNKLSELAEKPCVGVAVETEKDLISELLECDGVGMPLASTILKFICPDIFPIIDVRAYRALYGKKIRYDQYTVDLYIEYAKRIKDISEKGIPFKRVDELLYLLDKERNGKI